MTRTPRRIQCFAVMGLPLSSLVRQMGAGPAIDRKDICRSAISLEPRGTVIGRPCTAVRLRVLYSPKNPTGIFPSIALGIVLQQEGKVN